MGDRCHPYTSDLVCRGRFDAVMRGAFGWDKTLGGYVSQDISPRAQTPPIDENARWKRIYYGVEDCTGEAFVLEHCPYCGFPLPEYPGQKCDPYNGRDLLAELGLTDLPKLLNPGEMDVTQGDGEG